MTSLKPIIKLENNKFNKKNRKTANKHLVALLMDVHNSPDITITNTKPKKKVIII